MRPSKPVAPRVRRAQRSVILRRLKILGILVAVTAAAAPIRRMLLATQDGAPILSRPLPDTALLAPEPRFRMRCWWHWGRVSCGSAARSVMSPRGV